MGIQSINQTCKDHAPDAYGTMGLINFMRHRIAVDGNEFMYSAAATVIKGIIMNMIDPLEPMNRRELIMRLASTIVTFTVTMMKQNITIIWCWDGEAPAEKAYIRAKRKDARDRLKTRITECRGRLESKHVLSRSPELILEYKKLLCQDTTVSPKEMRELADFAAQIGFPSLTATGEAEKLCAALNREGLAKGVWSEDTDAYALGTPLLITGFSKTAQASVDVVVLQHMLDSYTHSVGWQFGLANMIDLCILHGTDFNPNMPGIGPKKAFDLIKRYMSIENIGVYDPSKPIGVLNYERTRQIFEYESSKYTPDSKEINVNPSLMRISEDILLAYGCQEMFSELVTAIQFVAPISIPPTIFDGVSGPVVPLPLPVKVEESLEAQITKLEDQLKVFNPFTTTHVSKPSSRVRLIQSLPTFSA